MTEKAEIIQGGEFEDTRGKLNFFNDFDMKPVKRFYIIEHPDIDIVRAWQAHQKEEKWFYVLDGGFKIVLVQPDDWERPSDMLAVEEFILQSTEQQILSVPGGHANGFKALEPKSKIMVFSSFTVEESSKDDYRFDKNNWYDWNEK